MKKFCFIFLIGIYALSSHAQEINVGFSTLAHLAKFEANYSLNEKFDVGGFYGLGIKGLAPHYFGGTFKYQFPKTSNQKGTLGGYVGGALGFAYTSPYEVYVIDGWNAYYEKYAGEKKFCGSIFAGTEQFVGRKERFSSFEELHLGYLPNYLGYALKGLFGALKGEGDTDPSKYSWWAIQFGFRIHFGR
jgi:hypothetical protein